MTTAEPEAGNPDLTNEIFIDSLNRLAADAAADGGQPGTVTDSGRKERGYRPGRRGPAA
jgi:hypothetical protein